MQSILAWHGWGFGPAAFDPLRAALAGRCTVSAPALSAPAVGGLGTWANALVPSVAEDQVLLGWSLGGMLAMAAVAAGARPRALVLVASSARFATAPDWPHALDADTVEAFRSGLARHPARTLQRFLALQAIGDARRAEVLTALEPAREHDSTQLGQALDALIGADLRDGIAAITTPTLILHGAHDALMPLAGAQWLAKALPHATLLTFADCGHAPHVSASGAVADALTEYIESLPDA